MFILNFAHQNQFSCSHKLFDDLDCVMVMFLLLFLIVFFSYFLCFFLLYFDKVATLLMTYLCNVCVCVYINI